jgi:hypothetical protein
MIAALVVVASTMLLPSTAPSAPAGPRRVVETTDAKPPPTTTSRAPTSTGPTSTETSHTTTSTTSTASTAVTTDTAPTPTATSTATANAAGEPATAATRRLEEARAAFARLDCDRVIDLASRVEDHRFSTTAERHEASFLRGYCAVVIGDNAAAQEAFTAVFTEDLDAAPPFEMEPRVLVLLEAARSAERERRAAVVARELAARRALVQLEVVRPEKPRGGGRAFFAITLRDPPGIVRSVRLEFRRQGEVDFYALPVRKNADGTLLGEIPGTYTRSATGLTLEWFIAAIDDNGAVVQSVGDRDRPEALSITPGSTLSADLRANERLSFPTRMTLALIGTPISSAVVATAAGVVAFALPESLRGISFAVLPAAGATLGTWLVTQSILDDVDALIPTAVTAGFGAFCVGAALISGVASGTLENSSLAENSGQIAVGGIVVGLLASAAVPATLVVLDPPSE